MLARWLQRQWFEQRRLAPALWLLLPLLLPVHALFVLISGARRRALRRQAVGRPVVVIGNITVGGAGKTPLTIALVKALQARGLRPGVISRGYGGQATTAQAVGDEARAVDVGDEPLLIARRTQVPVWIGRQRVAAASGLLAAHPEVDVLLCDDGLQHYRLARTVELAVFDQRGAGNAWRLPLGPLREPLARLDTVDAIVCNGPADPRLPRSTPQFAMKLHGGEFYRLGQVTQRCQAADLPAGRLHAVAGIGDPRRFFATLRGLGLQCVEHPFPDHHRYRVEDLQFGADAVVLMTEKDAVKCTGLALGEVWVLPVEAELPASLIDLVLEKIRGRPLA